AGEHHKVFEIAQTESHRRFQRSEWGFVAEVDLAVALVAGNHEAVAFTQAKEIFPIGRWHDGPGRISWRTDIDQLRRFPHLIRNRRPVDVEIKRRIAGNVVRCGSGEYRRAFINLIERIRANDSRVRSRWINHGLSERKQGFARAVDRKD